MVPGGLAQVVTTIVGNGKSLVWTTVSILHGQLNPFLTVDWGLGLTRGFPCLVAKPVGLGFRAPGEAMGANSSNVNNSAGISSAAFKLNNRRLQRCRITNSDRGRGSRGLER